VNVYAGLKRAWADPGPFSVVPNTLIALPGHTWEVDFLIGYRGRVGVIEVDGPTHRRKWASDRSRDRLLEDAGIAYIDRIAVEDTDDEAQVDQFVGRFVRRLAE
jgi:very-short-patch-repair endonuclease